ncbi:MAG: adenylate/guanylate cyclase domain-containing protein [Candidatus Wallbacteria bacterium]
MKNVKYPLKLKFIFLIATLATFIISITSLTYLMRETTLVTENNDRSSRLLMMTLARTFTELIIQQVYDEIISFEKHLAESGDNIVEISVFNNKWQYVAHYNRTGKNKLGDYLDETVIEKYKNINETVKTGNSGTDFVEYATPISIYSTKFGFLTITFSLARFKSEQAQSIEWITITAVIAILASILFSVTLSNIITKDLKNLTMGIQKVADGELNYRLSINSNDEFGLLANQFNEMAQGLLEKKLMSRFVSESVTDMVKTGGELSAAPGEERLVSILFADIRNFTSISEKCLPEEVVSMLNDYFERMTNIIKNNGGVVDKFIGDAIMAVFYPDNELEHEIRAVTAAMQMTEELQNYNNLRSSKNQFTVNIGIGINTGRVVAGTVGAKSGRLDYTVIGDAVNVASRLEGVSKLGKYSKIVVSAETMKAAESVFDFEKMSVTEVKGKQSQLEIFEVIKLKELDRIAENLNSENEMTRLMSVKLLGLSKNAKYCEKIAPLLKDNLPQIRIEAQFAIKNLVKQGETIMKYLREILDIETDPKILATLIAEAGISGNDDDRRALIKFLDHENYRVQANTIEAISLMNDRSVILIILKNRLSDPNNRSRANAAIRYYQLGEPDGLKTLINMCRDTSRHLMRASGAYGIGEATSREYSRSVFENISRLGDRIIDEHRLKLIDEARVTLEQLLGDPDLMVRINAASALGRMGNPLSIEALVIKYKTLQAGDSLIPHIISALKHLTSSHIFKMIEKNFAAKS